MNTSPSWRPPMFSLVCMVASLQSIARIEWGPVLAAARSTAGWLVSGALLLFSLVFRSGGSAEEALTSIYKAIALINWRAGLAAVRSFAERCGWQRLASAAFALLILLFASRGFQFKSRGVSLSLNVVSRSALCPDPRSRRAAAATLYSRYVCTSGGGASNPFDPSFGRPSETVARSCQFENVCWVNGSLKFFVAPGQGAGFIDEVATSTVRKGAPDGNFSPDVVLGPRPRDVPFSSAPFSILFSGYCAENFGVRAQARDRNRSISTRSICPWINPPPSLGGKFCTSQGACPEGGPRFRRQRTKKKTYVLASYRLPLPVHCILCPRPASHAILLAPLCSSVRN